MRPQTCASSTNSGLPGGWGIPSTRAAVSYSGVSQSCTVGASVTAYKTKTSKVTSAAAPYGGAVSSGAAGEPLTRLMSTHLARRLEAQRRVLEDRVRQHQRLARQRRILG